MQPDPGLMKTVVWATVGCGLLFGIAINAVVCWFLSKWLGRVPPEHRRLEPWKVWLLLIPFFGSVWMFFVYLPMAESFASWYRSRGQPAPSARGLALAYCLCALGSLLFSVPQLFLNPVYRGEPLGPPTPLLLGLQLGGGCVGVAALVLWILVLVRFHGLQKGIPAPAA